MERAVRKKKERAEQRKEARELTNSSKHSMLRLDVTGTSEVGMFKAHTNDIGMKLLEKMGYVAGRGLGKNEQGIVTPVEAKARPKHMGLGFNDYKENKLLVVPLSAEHKKKLQSNRGEKRKKAEILTKDDLLSKKQVEGTEDILQQKVNMRGPRARVLTNLENLNSNEYKEQREDVPTKELQYNIRVEIESTEADIRMKDRQLRKERERVESLLGEKKTREREEDRQRKQLQTIEVITGVLDRVQEDNRSGLLTLDLLLKTFLDLKNMYGDEYKMCNLSVVACAYALPLLSQAFHGWDPLQNPSHGLEIMRSWWDLVQGDQPYDYADNTYTGTVSPYTEMVGEVILPLVRLTGTNTWMVRDPEPMLSFLETWDRILPPLIIKSILEDVVMPKLQLALQKFEINPSNQKLDQFNWVIMWANAIPVRHMVHLLEFGFFNKWHLVLYHWLCSNPDYNEVCNWYLGWKNLFPDELLANERIRVLMSTGLDMMNRAFDENELVQPITRENARYQRATERRQMEAMQGTGMNVPDLSFKETVHAYASEQGILFMPRVGKLYNGYQVYDFGTVGIYMDSSRRLLYAQGKDGVWGAVTLAQLMDMNRTSRNG